MFAEGLIYESNRFFFRRFPFCSFNKSKFNVWPFIDRSSDHIHFFGARRHLDIIIYSFIRIEISMRQVYYYVWID